MGYAVGFRRNRWIGYGVPSLCDDGCGAEIDRGLSYLCGGGIDGDYGCGLFFSDSHMQYACFKDGEPFDEDSVEDANKLWRMEQSGEIEYAQLCPRCAAGDPPYEPTPDTDEWALHVLTDDSWQEWRDKNPGEAGDYYMQVRNDPRFNPLTPPSRDEQWAWVDSGSGIPGHWVVQEVSVT